MHAADAFESSGRRGARGRQAGCRLDACGSGPSPTRRRRSSIDRQGRITVDERLREFAQIPLSSKVIVTGNIDCVELWSDAVYREVAERTKAEMAATS